MAWYLSIEQGCTTVIIPGWAAIAAVFVAAAPRMAQKLFRERQTDS